ncbi:MAG: hypothetical protein KatS3mg129_2366 [Leptospiraceae bacterium]|nr:MAG: hypothetical protein KatS3mg129_2366 [Leptospiraceae bacterium]
MKLTESSFLITDLIEFENFYLELELKGILMLEQDFIDKSGNILIRKDTIIRPSFIERLKQNRGTYEEKFYIKITPQLINILSEYLSNIIVENIKKWDFLDKLYTVSLNKPRNIVKNALKYPKFCIATFILFKKNKEHFDYLSRMGLLTLAVVLLQELMMKGLYTFSFISAFISEFSFLNHQTAMQSYDDNYLHQQFIQKSIDLAKKLNLPVDTEKILSSIKILSALSEDQTLKEKNKEQIPEDPTLLIFDDEFLEDHPLEENVNEQNEQNEQNEEVDEEMLNHPEKQILSDKAIQIIAESIKFARYIFYLYEKVEDREHIYEEISYRIAYTTKRGFFDYNLLKPVIKKFKDLELEMRNLMLIASIEKKCLYPPSAWAYPKPRATQIICKHKVVDCPYIKLGWDLFVVKEQEPYGWIGTSLKEGRYFKCKLEDLLPSKKEDLIK